MPRPLGIPSVVTRTTRMGHFHISGLVGQGYEASVMSSSRNGVQATAVAEKYPIATYGLQVPRFEPCNLE